LKNIAVFLLFMALAGTCAAQSKSMRWAGDFSVVYLDFGATRTGKLSPLNALGRGLQTSGYWYARKWLNIGMTAIVAPTEDKYVIEGKPIASSLYDLSVVAQCKLNNGYWIPEESFFAPYFSAGMGINYFNNRIGVFAPATIGLRLAVSPTVHIQLQETYKIAFNTSPEHVVHSLGFVYVIPTGRPRSYKHEDRPPVKSERATVASRLADNDGDGVADLYDDCPSVAGTRGNHGCPVVDIVIPHSRLSTGHDGIVQDVATDEQLQAEIALVPQQATTTRLADRAEVPLQVDTDILKTIASSLAFEANRADITPGSLPTLGQVAAILDRYPEYNLRISGHTDNSGDPKDNLLLSIKRANQVKYYLAREKGISLDRLQADGYGAESPLADNKTEEGRKRNRRVEFVLYRSSQ